MIWLVWLLPRNNLGMRKVRPFVVRVKGIPQYLVLYSLEAKHSTVSVPFSGPSGATVKLRFWLVSGLYLGRHLPDFRGMQFRHDCGATKSDRLEKMQARE